MISIKHLVWLFVVFVSPGSFAQNSDSLLNQTDAQGRKQGNWQKTDASGKTIYKGQFKDNIPVGTFTYYYPDGGVKAISEISEEGQRSYTRTFYENGRMMTEGFYLNKKKDSVWKFFSIRGELLSEECYKNNLLNGSFISYYPDGKVFKTMIYRNAQKHGPWKEYHKNDSLKAEATYQNDSLQGQAVYFYSNGKKQAEGSYDHDLKTGEWKYFTREGVLQRNESYQQGMITGREIFIDIQSETEQAD